MKRKVLLDTNLADNVDESFALALAACSPELELVGATVWAQGRASDKTAPGSLAH